MCVTSTVNRLYVNENSNVTSSIRLNSVYRLKHDITQVVESERYKMVVVLFTYGALWAYSHNPLFQYGVCRLLIVD